MNDIDHLIRDLCRDLTLDTSPSEVTRRGRQRAMRRRIGAVHIGVTALALGAVGVAATTGDGGNPRPMAEASRRWGSV